MKPTPAVIYLHAPDEQTALVLDGAERRCRAYADWWRMTVVEVVRDIGGSDFSPHRDGLQRVYHLLKTSQAEGVITTDRTMLGGDTDTYEQVAGIIEGAQFGGFIALAT